MSYDLHNKAMMELTQEEKSDKVLKPLAAGVFLIFFNAYMIAPIIPAIAREFSASNQRVGLVVPAYMLTYGFSTLLYGPLSDRIGRRKILLTFLALTVAATALCATAWSADSLIALRILCGVCAGGFLPISLAMIGDLYPFAKIGRPMGWMFGAVAGGSSFGSTLGAWLNPVIGWRNELLLLAVGVALVFAALWKNRAYISESKSAPLSAALVAKNYGTLLRNPRASKLYSFIFLNGAFHSGIFSWLGLYLVQRYDLSDGQIGTALLGYGLPGMFLGPVFGKLADRYGRKTIIPLGFLVASTCAFSLVPVTSLWIAAIMITFLSVGLDMTHPLMTGIVSTLDPKRRGQAMGLNAFTIFTGFGAGALAFQIMMSHSMGFALSVFGVTQGLLALLALRFFRGEGPRILPQ